MIRVFMIAFSHRALATDGGVLAALGQEETIPAWFLLRMLVLRGMSLAIASDAHIPRCVKILRLANDRGPSSRC